MEILKKATNIGKSEIFFELTVSEIKSIQPGVELLIPKKRKELQKLEDKYEGQANLYDKISDLRQEIKFLEYLKEI